MINSINKKYIDELSFEHKDGYDSNYQKAIHFAEGNRKSPTLVFLYSVHTDHAGHGYGWMSPEYVKAVEAVEAADVALGAFVEQLKSKDFLRILTFFSLPIMVVLIKGMMA